MERQQVDTSIYEKYKLPYKYESYKIYGKEEDIIDYYRLYYLPHNSTNPILPDNESNSFQIISINRHVHILLEHFNVSCDISQCGDGKTRESMGVLVTYLYSLRYHKKFPINIDKINICIIGPANSRKTWITESGMNYDGIGKVKFYSINTIQGNKINLPQKNGMLSGKIENGKIIYSPGKILKKLVNYNYCFIFDEFHYAKNDCLSSDASIAITNYINRNGIYLEYNYEIIDRLKRKIEKGKIEKYLPMLIEECFKNKIIFMSATLTDKKDITTILKSLNIIDRRLIFGGRGIGSVKNYEQLKEFLDKSRIFEPKNSRKIEKEILSSNRDLLTMTDVKIQKKFSNDILSKLVNEIFTHIWIPLLFSHMTPNTVSEFEPEIYNSFHRLKYGDKEIVSLSKKLLKRANKKDSCLKKFGSKIESMELATIPVLEGLSREIIKENENNRVIIPVPKIIIVNILSKLLSDINHLIITSEVTDRSDGIKKFQKNSEESPKIIIATIKSIHQSINLDDKDGNYRRYILAIPTFAVIESFQLIGRVFRRHTTKSKAIVKFIYIVSSDVEEFDKETLLSIDESKELSKKNPIQFSIILSNLNRSDCLERFIFANYSFLPKNMNFEFINEPRFPETREKYKNYVSIRNNELED